MTKVFHIPPDGCLYEDLEDPFHDLETDLIFLCGETWDREKEHFVQEGGSPANCDACILMAFSKGIKIK